jgi:hypothetical protein
MLAFWGIAIGFGIFYLFLNLRKYEKNKNIKNRIIAVKNQYNQGFAFVELYVFQTNHFYLQEESELFGGIRFLKKDSEYYFSELILDNNLNISGSKIFKVKDVASCRRDSETSINTTSSLGKQVMYGDSTVVSSKTYYQLFFLFKDITITPLTYQGTQEECAYLENLFNNTDKLIIELSKCKVLTFPDIMSTLPDKVKKSYSN